MDGWMDGWIDSGLAHDMRLDSGCGIEAWSQTLSQLEIILTAKFRSGDGVINFFFYNHTETLRDQRRQQDGSKETKSSLTTV